MAFFFFRETNRSIKQHKPFEKEKVLCDTLIVHLEKLHVSQAPDVSSATASDKELSLPQRAGVDEASVVISSQYDLHCLSLILDLSISRYKFSKLISLNVTDYCTFVKLEDP